MLMLYVVVVLHCRRGLSRVSAAGRRFRICFVIGELIHTDGLDPILVGEQE